ncbi:cytochrome P450 [Mycobacterium talmoniae]|uniref:Calcium-binding protein n=1 Tax=Mycobacterium talmoniae TaxID=1858794 RepID=A0A1S1NQJ0_9MYCO|nr:cytochrome P450 [Mycobacterium talmoniae]OHV06909.1 calcium-binding protein [Mycobacterium talmoniae]PQM47984.1 Mycinamicin IV hydroxylase/epoxidase [Mycobacterium talmoniae]
MTANAPRTVRCPAIDYDFADPVVKSRLHEALADIRQRCPIGWSEQYGGFWLLATYEGVLDAARDHQRYTTTGGIMIPPTGASMPVIPAELDPPEHTPYRKLIMPFFTKPAIAALESRLRGIVRECIAAFSADGHADLVRSVAEIVPPLAIGAALGLQPEECTGVRELTGNFLSSAKAGIEAKMAAAKELESWLEELINNRRTHPRDDTLSKLVNARINNEEILPATALGMVQLVVVAGHETTVHGIGSMLFRLATEPGLKDRLLADPTMMSATVHESLRIDPPIIHMARTAVNDHARSGAQLRRGDKVMLNFGAANRDPAKFPDPFTFDIDRPSNQHLTFGSGYHRCLGEYLAVTEMLIVLEEILATIPDYTLSGEGGPTAVEWGGGGNTRGPAKLEVMFTPVPR